MKAATDERKGKRIAKKVMLEMLASIEHRRDIDAVAEHHVESRAQMIHARKQIRVYCRKLSVALRKLP